MCSKKLNVFFTLLLSITITSCAANSNKYDDKNAENINIESSDSNSMKNNKLNKKAVSGFYSAFQKNNPEGMVKYYSDDVEFEDPAFGKLKGERAKDMWRMLSEIGKGNIKVTFKNIQIEGDKGSAEWEAVYNFSQTGREVHNKVKASFEFKDGLIVKHTDSFDLWAWSRMAFGFTGYVLGFTPFFKSKLNTETNKQLDKFMEKRQAEGKK